MDTNRQKNHKVTTADLRYIKEHAFNSSIKEMAQYIGCSPSTINKCLWHLGIEKHGKYGTSEIIKFFKAHYRIDMRGKDIAEALNIPYNSVWHLAKRFGLSKDQRKNKPRALYNKEYMKAYYIRNKEKIKEYNLKQYYKKKKDEDSTTTKS